MDKIKSGFVSLVGRPNTGKSTLMNTILEKDISIVTDKAQTTRNKINGIYNKDNLQIVFVDTPGVHNVKNELDRFMNRTALQATKGTDLILFLAPANEHIGKNDLFILQNLKDREIEIVLLITKIDTVSKAELDAKIAEWKGVAKDIKKIIPISAVAGAGLNELMAEIAANIPETGYKFYPDEMSSDQPERFIVREIIREQILNLTSEEVPHSVAILIDEFKETKTLLRVTASIVMERESQKGIIIGAKGAMIKTIGIKAREKMESIFGSKVFLELFVRTNKNWRQSASLIKRMGYDKDTY
jgi:GTP-binding protein Era